MAKKIVEHIIVGLGIGFVCTTACLWLFGAYNGDGMAVMRQFSAWLGASFLYGAVSVIYDSDIPFPLSLIIHFTACLLITYAASAVSGLFNFIKWGEWFIYVLPSFVIIYLIIGTVTTLAAKGTSKKINDKIQNG